MSSYKLNASILIGEGYSVEIVPYILSIRREASVCNIMQEFTLEVEPALFTYLDSIPLKINPYTPIQIYEAGTKVLTGYFGKADFGRRPGPRQRLSGGDTYKRAKDYFIEEDNLISTGETVGYWLEYLLGLAGLTFVTDFDFITDGRTVAPGASFGLRTVADAITEVLAYASGYLYVDPNGIIHFAKGTLTDKKFRFETGPLTTFIDDNFTVYSGGNVLHATSEVSDVMTRNVVKVWGYRAPNYTGQVKGDPIIRAERRHGGLPVDKTVLYSSPMIETQEEADRLANEMAAEFFPFTRTRIFEVPGNPEIKVGRRGRFIVNLESVVDNAYDMITNIDSTMDKEGYKMVIKIGEKCPKFAGWSKGTPGNPPVYAGTRAAGVYRSVDAGNDWSGYNTGLPEGKKYSLKVATNLDDQVMSITNNKLYRRMSIDEPWELIVLPAGVNTAGDIPAIPIQTLVALDSPYTDTFHFLANAKKVLPPTITSGGIAVSGLIMGRSWVFSTYDFGQTWQSIQLYNDEIVTSGVNFVGGGVLVSGMDKWGLTGLDLSSKYGQIKVLAAPMYGHQLPRGTIRMGIGTEATFDESLNGVGGPTYPIGPFGVSGWILDNYEITGSAPNRVLKLYIRFWGRTSGYTISPGLCEFDFRVMSDYKAWFSEDVIQATTGLNIHTAEAALKYYRIIFGFDISGPAFNIVKTITINEAEVGTFFSAHWNFWMRAQAGVNDYTVISGTTEAYGLFDPFFDIASKLEFGYLTFDFDNVESSPLF